MFEVKMVQLYGMKLQEKARENLEESREHFLNKEDTDKEVVEEIYKK